MQDNLNISNELRSTLQKIKNMDGGAFRFWSKKEDTPVNQEPTTNQPTANQQYEFRQQPIVNQQPLTNQQQYTDAKNLQSIPLYNDGFSQALSESPEFQEGYNEGIEYIQKRSNQFIENPVDKEYEEYPGDERYHNKSNNNDQQMPTVRHVNNLMDNYLSKKDTYTNLNESPDYENSKDNYESSEENPSHDNKYNNLQEKPQEEFPPKERYIPSFKKYRDPKLELNDYQNNSKEKRYMIKYLNTK